MGLLVLSRMQDEGCVITVPPSTEETEILVLVTDLRTEVNPFTGEPGKKKARLGFSAPRQVSIDRTEVRRRKVAGKAQATP